MGCDKLREGSREGSRAGQQRSSRAGQAFSREATSLHPPQKKPFCVT